MQAAICFPLCGPILKHTQVVRVTPSACIQFPDRIIKLHIAIWHAGPHFVHGECELNFENLDTNRIIHALPLPADDCYQL